MDESEKIMQMYCLLKNSEMARRAEHFSYSKFINNFLSSFEKSNKKDSYDVWKLR